MPLLLGAIADDFTGASDLANTLVKSGMRTVQTIGIPDPSLDMTGVDAVVIALKSRSIPVADAVEQSLAALDWLKSNKTEQIFFKYCSTFDSTDEGNIGPVADALLDACDDDFTIFCPAFPENGRQIFNGYLFVGPVLLSESSMRDHPLTPMTDPSLVRVLSRQTRHKVDLIDLKTVRAGAGAIEARIAELRAAGVRHAIVDAAVDDDLLAIGPALGDLKLITGGSGIALGLPENFRASGKLDAGQKSDQLSPVNGPALALSGSCSQATRAQVAAFKEKVESFQITPEMAIEKGRAIAAEIIDWATPKLGEKPILISATSDPETVKELQDALGRDEAGAVMEDILAEVARRLHLAGARRIVVAGGETSGAVVNALDVSALRIGPQIDPGVPWTASVSDDPVLLTMKSGNFGAPDFFEKAFAQSEQMGGN